MLIRQATGPGFAPGIKLEFGDNAISLDDIPETVEDLANPKKHGALVALQGLLQSRIKSGQPVTLNDIVAFQQLQLRLRAFVLDTASKKAASPELQNWGAYAITLLGYFEIIDALPKAPTPVMAAVEIEMLILTPNLPIEVKDLADEAKRSALTGLQPLLAHGIAAKNDGQELSGIAAVVLRARLNIFRNKLAASTEANAPSWIAYVDGLLILLSRFN